MPDIDKLLRHAEDAANARPVEWDEVRRYVGHIATELGEGGRMREGEPGRFAALVRFLRANGQSLPPGNGSAPTTEDIIELQ